MSSWVLSKQQERISLKNTHGTQSDKSLRTLDPNVHDVEKYLFYHIWILWILGFSTLSVPTCPALRDILQSRARYDVSCTLAVYFDSFRKASHLKISPWPPPPTQTLVNKNWKVLRIYTRQGNAGSLRGWIKMTIIRRCLIIEHLSSPLYRGPHFTMNGMSAIVNSRTWFHFSISSNAHPTPKREQIRQRRYRDYEN